MCQRGILSANFKLFHNIETKCSMYKLSDIQEPENQIRFCTIPRILQIM